MVFDGFAEKSWKERKTLPGRATYPKPFRSRADKVSAASYLGDHTDELHLPDYPRATSSQSHGPSPDLEGNVRQYEIGNPHDQGEAARHSRAGHRDTGEVGGRLVPNSIPISSAVRAAEAIGPAGETQFKVL